jgi:HAD superfamily hydrolase (TIGR01490 family)
MPIAFFDLDKTLLSRNSAALWVRSELAAGRATKWQALKAFGWVLRYNLGAADMTEPIRRGALLLAGQREEEMAARVRSFYAAVVRTLYRPGGIEAVRAHRAAGDRVVLLTSSSNYMCEMVLRDLAIDDYLCNRFEVAADGRYTGRAIEPLCFGPGKVLIAERYAAEHGGRLADAAFYTDSHSDVPVLEAVGRPVAVNPDPRLRRHARRRNWETVDWGSAVGP